MGCVLALGGCASTSSAPVALPALSLLVPAPGHLTPRPAPAPPQPAPCRVRGTSADAARTPDGSVALRATRDGAPFADMSFVKGDDVTLTLFDGAADAQLDARFDHVAFTAWTERDAFLYEPSERFAVDGYLLPYGEKTPQWHYAGGGEFRAEVPVPAGLRPATGPGPFRASRSCDEMSVTAGWARDQTVDSAASLAGIRLDSYETVELNAGASLPLATQPGGPTVAFVEPTETIAVQVRDAPLNTVPPAGDVAYVTWDTGDALVFGWASRALLGPIAGGGGRGRGIGCSMQVRYVRGPVTFRQCEADVPLLVRADPDAAATAVGTLGHEALFRVEETAGDDLVRVRPELAGLSMSLRDGADFFVRSGDLAACPEVVIDW
jgi:hypothetical protein